MDKKYIEILTPILAVLAALLIGGIIIQLNGVNALEAYGQLFKSAFYQANPKAPFMSGLAKTLLTATPLIFVGLSVMLAFKAGLFNIGAQGQMIMGGMAAAVVGIYVKNGILGNFVVALIAAGIAGFLWAGIAGYLKAKFGVHEVISTIMLNYIAINLQNYLLNYPLKDPASQNVQTMKVLEPARLFLLAPSTKQKLNLGFILAIVAVILVWYFFSKTRQGYEMKAVGLNQGSSENAGIKIKKTLILAMGISGILAGLGGAERVLGGTAQYAYTELIMGDLGFTGVAVSLLGKSNPFGVFIAAIFYASLEIGGQSLQSMKLPKEVVSIIQALIIIFVAGENMFRMMLKRGGKKK